MMSPDPRRSILWSDPERGISGERKGRTLLTHAEEEFQEQGLAFSFSWEPSLSLSHAMGATAAGGRCLTQPHHHGGAGC